MNLEDFKKKWELAADAFSGEGVFSAGDCLVRHGREDDEKLSSRKEIYFYRNYMRPAVRRFVSAMSKKTVSRTTKNEKIAAIIDNVDMQGNSAHVFFSRFAEQAKTRGCMLLLIDKEATEKASGRAALPYMQAIEPERVHSFKTDTFGSIEWIIIESSEDVTEPFGEAKVELVLYYYDKMRWEKRSEDGSSIIESGDHNLGVCPVIAFGESGTFPSIGSFVQIAEISKSIMNKRSELDDMLRSHTFNVLTIEMPEHDIPLADNDGALPEVRIATDNVLFYQKNRPDYIAPDSKPAEIYQDDIERLVGEIDTISHRIIASAQKETAEAIRFRYEELNSELIAFARNMEDFERIAFDIVKKWMRLESVEVVISYPKDYSISDLALEVEVYQNLKGQISPTYEKLKREEIARLDMPGIDQETLDVIRAEIGKAVDQEAQDVYGEDG